MKDFAEYDYMKEIFDQAKDLLSVEHARILAVASDLEKAVALIDKRLVVQGARSDVHGEELAKISYHIQNQFNTICTICEQMENLQRENERLKQQIFQMKQEKMI